jgi:hypothetical protein
MCIQYLIAKYNEDYNLWDRHFFSQETEIYYILLKCEVYGRCEYELRKEILWKSKNSNCNSPGFHGETQDAIVKVCEISSWDCVIPRY